MFELTENEFMECEEAERRKHDEKVRELENECKICKGRGMMQICDMYGNICRGLKVCPYCNGTGKVNNGIKE